MQAVIIIKSPKIFETFRVVKTWPTHHCMAVKYFFARQWRAEGGADGATAPGIQGASFRTKM